MVWTRAALDREERPALLVPLVVGDAGWPTLTATVTLTLHVADVNDNPMAPAAKTVTVHTMQVNYKITFHSQLDSLREITIWLCVKS